MGEPFAAVRPGFEVPETVAWFVDFVLAGTAGCVMASSLAGTVPCETFGAEGCA